MGLCIGKSLFLSCLWYYRISLTSMTLLYPGNVTLLQHVSLGQGTYLQNYEIYYSNIIKQGLVSNP